MNCKALICHFSSALLLRTYSHSTMLPATCLQAGPAAGAAAADAGTAPTPMAALAEGGASPEEVLAGVQASAKKRLSSAGRRRSLSRTPGTKIVIIERGTQMTPSSAAKRAPAPQVRRVGRSPARGDAPPCVPFLPPWLSMQPVMEPSSLQG